MSAKLYIADLTGTPERAAMTGGEGDFLPALVCAAELLQWTDAQSSGDGRAHQWECGVASLRAHLATGAQAFALPETCHCHNKYFSTNVELVLLTGNVAEAVATLLRDERADGDGFGFVFVFDHAQMPSRGAPTSDLGQGVPWQLLGAGPPSRCLFAAALVFGAQPAATEGCAASVRRDAQEQWRLWCLDRGLEYVPHAALQQHPSPRLQPVAAQSAAAPLLARQGAGPPGAGDVVGTNRVYQLLCNTVWPAHLREETTHTSRTTTTTTKNKEDGKGITVGQGGGAHTRYNPFLVVSTSEVGSRGAEGTNLLTDFLSFLSHHGREDETKHENKTHLRYYTRVVSRASLNAQTTDGQHNTQDTNSSKHPNAPRGSSPTSSYYLPDALLYPPLASLQQRTRTPGTDDAAVVLCNKYYCTLLSPIAMHYTLFCEDGLSDLCRTTVEGLWAPTATRRPKPPLAVVLWPPPPLPAAGGAGQARASLLARLLASLRQHLGPRPEEAADGDDLQVVLVAHGGDLSRDEETLCARAGVEVIRAAPQEGEEGDEDEEELTGAERLREVLHLAAWHDVRLLAPPPAPPPPPSHHHNALQLHVFARAAATEEGYLRDWVGRWAAAAQEPPPPPPEDALWRRLVAELPSLAHIAPLPTRRRAAVGPPLHVATKYFSADIDVVLRRGGLVPPRPTAAGEGEGATGEGTPQQRHNTVVMVELAFLQQCADDTRRARAGEEAKREAFLHVLREMQRVKQALWERNLQHWCTPGKETTEEEEALTLVYVLYDADAPDAVSREEVAETAADLCQALLPPPRGQEEEVLLVEVVCDALQGLHREARHPPPAKTGAHGVGVPEGMARLREAVAQHPWRPRPAPPATPVPVLLERPAVTCALPPDYLVDPQSLRSVRVAALTVLLRDGDDDDDANSKEKAARCERDTPTQGEDEEEEEAAAAVQPYAAEIKDWVYRMKTYGAALGKDVREQQAARLAMVLEKLL
ncbi:hypothetical protein STCU_10926 [Strigomonas culicis]|uniref:Uncharacterized protein n=1 Tax=Strigomonas culicis TaxID=28005 RepID=S9TKM3_9TRYP|nr:hypothetical protein STCU_10926 [Strigomonas culicis]|eukprot:EPY16883.1 hypothetical protein STCU_10926 [Strigomonas culicis]